MIILDPDMNGCCVWLINSPVNGYKPNVTYIKGNPEEVCDTLRKSFAFYREYESGYKELIWVDDIYLDIAAIGHEYKYIFDRKYNLPVIDVIGKSRNVITERLRNNENIESK